MDRMPFDVFQNALKLRRLADDMDRMSDPAYLHGIRPDVMISDWRPAMHFASNLTGRVYGHPKFGDGRAIVTSQLFYINEELGLARSLSRWYRLGPRDGLSASATDH